jgi:hypothetical protein
MAYVELSSDTTKVVTLYAGHQAVGDKGGAVVSISATDARVVAFQAAQAAQASYNSAIAAGLAVTSTATPALSATYGIDAGAQFNITAETVSILTNGTFTNGQSTRNWADVSGAFHTFTVAQFKTFATAIAGYVDELAVALATAQASGGGWTAPSASATIA